MPYNRQQCKLFFVKEGKGEKVPSDFHKKCRGVKRKADGGMVVDKFYADGGMVGNRDFSKKC